MVLKAKQSSEQVSPAENRKPAMAAFWRKCHIYNHNDRLSNQVKNYTENIYIFSRRENAVRPNWKKNKMDVEFKCQPHDIFKLKFAIQWKCTLFGAHLDVFVCVGVWFKIQYLITEVDILVIELTQEYISNGQSLPNGYWSVLGWYHIFVWFYQLKKLRGIQKGIQEDITVCTVPIRILPVYCVPECNKLYFYIILCLCPFHVIVGQVAHELAIHTLYSGTYSRGTGSLLNSPKCRQIDFMYHRLYGNRKVFFG